ncbi:glycosyltransferase [Schleiferilactobacillus harbinensis]|uniref:glycosyltransferase n=1 Tax=Schleiferilactobacillus harbinensis TaxID=304207 RepID=UPI00345E79D6
MNFYVNGTMGIGNSGIEHAEFYRARLFKTIGLPFKFVFVDLAPELREAMKAWHLANDSVANMWEYFTLGDDYLRHGIAREFKAKKDLVIDSTKTHRKRETWTTGGLRIVEHLVKYANTHEKTDVLLVSTARVEIFSRLDGRRKVEFEYVDDPHRKFLMRNIHVFGLNGQHLFFPNEVPARRYFFHQLARAYSGHNVFIIDRGERNEVALYTPKIPDAAVIHVVHADHLGDRNDPAKPLWNNYYEYLLTHLNKVAKVVVATDMQREDLLKDFPNQANKFVTIPVGGVRDLNQATVDYDRSRQTPLKLITASRLAPEKNVDLIVRAVAKLHDEGTPVTLTIFGAGVQQSKLQESIKALDAADYVTLAGQSQHLAVEYPKYDAFISASYSEGFGLTYIEALNAALPVISFNARFGALELIKDGVNGFLQPFRRDDDQYNIDQLVLGIQRLLAADYSQLRRNTRNSVIPYQDHVIAKEWKVLIDEL